VATAYAVVSDGSVWAWGQGRDGNLGDGQLTNNPVPARLTSITSPVQAVVTANSSSPGYTATVALGTDGSLWSWGAYYAGWTGATGLGPEGGTATASRVPRVPPACRIATLGGDIWFASLC
jgi:alpha-tubulin suppressor-like RCC1 family protein